MSSFCTECQAAWARPWYDVCPHCGHRFKAKPSLMPATIAMLAGPIVMLAIIWLGEKSVVDSIEQVIFAGIAVMIIGAIVTAVLLARRTSYPTWGKVVLGIVLAPLILVVTGALTFGGCVLIANRI